MFFIALKLVGANFNIECVEFFLLNKLALANSCVSLKGGKI